MTGPSPSPGTGATPSPAPSPRVRRRLVDSPGQDTHGRAGCLITGAFLGIIAGATFAFYGLPPILKHFYGEQHIALGAHYTGDAKDIRVLSLSNQPALPGSNQPLVTVVELAVSTNKTWTPSASDFSLEFTNRSDWPKATALSAGPGATPSGAIEFGVAQLGVEATIRVVFAFPLPPNGPPTYLHIADPLVRIALPPPTTPN